MRQQLNRSRRQSKRSKLRLSLEQLESRRLLASVSSPAILQWFESSFDTIEQRTPDIFDAGYGTVWLPPPNRADSGNLSVGYDVYDRFDLGSPDDPTLYGTETELKTIANAFDNAGVALHVDVVLNHAGFTDLGSNGFFESGGYPGLAITLPNSIDGDFHSGFLSGDLEGRLAGLVDIDHQTNHQFIRSPVAPDDPNNLRPGTAPFNGRVANLPDEANRRFYPDRDADPIFLFDPATGESGIAVYPFNTDSPETGDPVLENALGYQMRWLQWLVQDVGVDGFRLDATKHLDPFVLNFFDRAVYRSNPRLLLDGSVDHAFSYGEAFTGDRNALMSYVRKDINPNDFGRVGGNRDTLDFSAFFAMHSNLASAGTSNAWTNIRDSLLDLHDDGIHNGSAGVLFVGSHDENGPNELNNVAHAFALMYPGNTVVYFNGKEFGDNRDFPKDGRGDALGGVYGDSLKRLVQIRNTHGRGNFLERYISSDGIYVYERESSAVVGLSNRGDSGFDQRTVSVAFAPGTHLVELTGNAANTFIDPFNDIPDVVTVKSDGTIDIRVPRNRNANGDFHGSGYVIYGLPTPQAPAGLEVLGSTSVLAGSVPAAQSFANGVTRLSDLTVITSDSFDVRLQTNEVRLLGLESLRDTYADGDQAVLRVNGGTDVNGNGQVDFVTPGDASYGFETFGNKASSLVGSGGISGPRGDGEFLQTIDATQLSEGINYIEARAFRHRTDGGPAVFSDFRESIYVDRFAPESRVLSFEPWEVGVNENRNLIVESVDKTADAVHVFLDLPASMTDAEVMSLVSEQNQARQIDRDQFIYGFGGLSHGNHAVTIVTYEQSGNVNVQRSAGLFTSTIIGAGLGDTDFDGDIDMTDHDRMLELVDGNNDEFNAAADFDANGVIDAEDYRIFLDEFIDQVRGPIDFGDAPASSLAPYFSDRFTAGETAIVLSAPGGDVGLQASQTILSSGIARDDTSSDTLYFRFTANPTSIGSSGISDAFSAFQLFQNGEEGLGIGNRFGSAAWSYFGASDLVTQSETGDLNSPTPDSGTSSETIQENEAKTFLMRVEYQSDAEDVITVWMQPGDVFDADQLPDLTTTFFADASFDEVIVRAGSDQDAATWAFSDIAISKQTRPGPAHLISNELKMGFQVDADGGQQTSNDALGDDSDGNDDEDGILFSSTPIPGGTWPLEIGASATGLVDGWIDFNANGILEHPAEHIGDGVSIPVGIGLTTVNVSVPSDALVGQRLMRLRISTDGGLTPNAYAADGEVEDHLVQISDPNLSLDLAAIGATTVTVERNGDRIEVVDNTGNVLISQTIAATDSLTITGANAIPESVTIDYAAGGFFDLDNGVVFNAGEGNGDALSVIGIPSGASAISAQYVSNNTMLGNATIVANSGTQSTSVHFSGVEPLSILGMANISFTGTLQVGTDTLSLGSANPIELPASVVFSGGTIESSGPVSLLGTLSGGTALTIQVAGNFQPQPGDSFDLITADGGVSGSFDSAILPPIQAASGDDLAWSIRYGSDAIRAEIVPAAQVESVVINEGQSQRSALTSVEVTFTEVVDIDLSGSPAFEFVNLDNGLVAATSSPLITLVDDKTVATFRFLPGQTVNAGQSMTDGRYQLRIDPAKVTIGGIELDGNGDGQAGDEYRFGDHPNDDFFRKYGDQDGDDFVGLADFALFRSTFGSRDGQEPFLPGLDSNADGEIGLTDFAAFRSNFGR
ncbi:Glucan 1,4-alpha-maltohexaosidase precursor [Rubripirellula obstinata]|uniref:Glucan 1,4-alpha-maltohexaosidase n=1 Tax=Rubripirellula obstinata TaxID=406547 RepID=A0A5B1CLA8_9BACT|nr:GEVED domain-containing protein [Rubripirellula obstinata]KAA1261316.1 Glucan 1,4-alpha-maltohexaosidase precursor [Rubripirellula obstinata]